MSISALTSSLLSANSIRNMNIDTARAKMSVEEMRIRSSSVGLLQILARSKILDSYINAKAKAAAGKDPLLKAQFELDKDNRQAEFQFKAFTVKSLNGLKRKVDLLTSISERNSRLVEHVYNEMGKYKSDKKINPKNPPKATRIPFKDKTVKSQIEQINKELQKLKSVKTPSRKKSGVSAPRGKKQEDMMLPENMNSGSLMGNLLEAIIVSRLLGGKGGAGIGKGLLRGGGLLLGGLSLYNLPGALRSTADRFQGRDAKSDPIAEQISRMTTPLATGAGVYTAAELARFAYNKIRGPRLDAFDPVSRAELKKGGEVYRKRFQLSDEVYERARNARSLEYRRDSALTRFNNERRYARLPDTLTPNERARVGDRIAARSNQRLDDIDRRRDTRLARIQAAGDSRMAAYSKQMVKWRKVTSVLSGLSKRVPAASLAYVAFKVSEMSNYVSDYSQKRISFSEYKEMMSQSYGDIANTIGSTAMGAVVGGLAGSIFPGIGTIGGGLVGAAGGMVASLFMDESSSSKWMGEKLFELIHEDKSTAARSSTDLQRAETSSPPPAVNPEVMRTTTTPASNQELKAVSESGSGNEAMQFFIEKGWTKEQAAGIVGNLMAESGTSLRTDSLGDGGKAYGIAQWHADRQQKFAEVFQKPIQQSSFREQLEFVQWELMNSEKSAGEKLRGATAPADSAFVIDKYYERSSGIHLQKRIDYAKKLLERYGVESPKASDVVANRATGQILRTMVAGQVVRGAMSDQQFSVLSAEAFRSGNVNSQNWEKESLEFMRQNYSPDIVRAYERKMKESASNQRVVDPPLTSTQQSEQIDRSELDTAVATSIAALAKTRQLDQGIGILADQVIDTRQAVASQIPFPSSAHDDSSFQTFGRRA
jgi:Phage tail lysozyme